MEQGFKQYENAEMGITLNVNIGELAYGSLLKNKIVLVTGACGGIGFEISKACISQGAKVIITDINEQKLIDAENALGENCKHLVFDVLDFERYDTLFYEASAFFGEINCLVNNAGISLHEGGFMNVTVETWDKQLDINLKAPFFLTQKYYQYYSERQIKNGRIVMLASDTSGMGSSIPYGLSKCGIASLTVGLAKKFITEGLRINALAPGTTKTAMTDDFTHGEVCRQTTQGKRVIFPQEIAQSAVFLLSDLSACISGQIIGCTEANICFDNSYREEETNP